MGLGVKSELQLQLVPQFASTPDVFFFFFLTFGAAPLAYGSSKARGGIGAAGASLCYSHSNMGSELRLRPTPQLTAKPDP